MKSKLFLLGVLASLCGLSMSPKVVQSEESTSLCAMQQDTKIVNCNLTSYFSLNKCQWVNTTIQTRYTCGFIGKTPVAMPGQFSAYGYEYSFMETVQPDNRIEEYYLLYKNMTTVTKSVPYSSVPSDGFGKCGFTFGESVTEAEKGILKTQFGVMCEYFKVDIGLGRSFSESSSYGVSSNIELRFYTNENGYKDVLADYYVNQYIVMHVFYQNFQWNKEYLYSRQIDHIKLRLA